MNLIPALAALTLAAAMPLGATLLTTDSPEAAAVTIAQDDPTTVINEGATLDTSRVNAPRRTNYTADFDTLARTYAGAHSLTGCTTPDAASLDDIFLAVGVDDHLVQELTLDEALESTDRVVLLACDAR